MSTKSHLIDTQAEKALRESDTEAVAIEMTPELKQKFSRISGEVIDLLRAKTEGPIEAYILLKFIQHAFEEHYGIRWGVIMGPEVEG